MHNWKSIQLLMMTGLLAGLVGGAAGAGQPASRNYDLGPAGEIRNMLVLGYLPGSVPVETDRLAAVGGEAGLQPFGGETVTVPVGTGALATNLVLSWKTVEATQPEIPWLMTPWPQIALFADTNGAPVPNATAYLYGELMATQAERVGLLISSGDPIRVLFNGRDVTPTNRPYWRYDDASEVALALSNGVNRLLVRMDNRGQDESLVLRLVTAAGERPGNIAVRLRQMPDCPAFERGTLAQIAWSNLVAEIPPVPAAEDCNDFGANLGRTLTLLESGAVSKRPVRMLFYGQSITASEWVWLLVRRLRERYPGTEIQAENWAIGGWGIDRLCRTMKHDIERARPDLVVVHAYTGGSWSWERLIQHLRSETTAEVMIRSAHIGKYEETGQPLPEESAESLLLRRLARTYGCEFVECRREWLGYLRAHSLEPKDLRADGIHLNRKGVLMAQLYERHFRPQVRTPPWFDTVRRYEAMRSSADRRHDEVRLTGSGWDDRAVAFMVSTSATDRLDLRFTGNRVDAIMPPGDGAARVLIDGRPPSALNLFRGTRPLTRRGYPPPAELMTYYMGTNMLEEAWELTFTHASGDAKKFRYAVRGSRTGPDGEGDSGALFVSRSGRITINPDDFLFNPTGADTNKTELAALTRDVRLGWLIKPTSVDVLQNIPLRPGEPGGERYTVPYRYVNVVDGLEPGEHALTLLHEGPRKFVIEALEVHRPPLMAR